MPATMPATASTAPYLGPPAANEQKKTPRKAFTSRGALSRFSA